MLCLCEQVYNVFVEIMARACVLYNTNVYLQYQNITIKKPYILYYVYQDCQTLTSGCPTSNDDDPRTPTPRRLHLQSADCHVLVFLAPGAVRLSKSIGGKERIEIAF